MLLTLQKVIFGWLLLALATQGIAAQLWLPANTGCQMGSGQPMMMSDSASASDQHHVMNEQDKLMQSSQNCCDTHCDMGGCASASIHSFIPLQFLPFSVAHTAYSVRFYDRSRTSVFRPPIFS